ncbi:MAG: hypothetical protein WBA57_04165 [Elainellaceae cyanobacterium]
MPDNDFIDWIISRADNRIIFDVGFGNGRVLEHIWERGYSKLVGTDPFSDVMAINTHWIMNKELNGRSKPHFFYDEIGEGISQSILENSKGKMLGLLNRPCHHTLLVKSAYYSFKKTGNELLYIGLRENIEQDLVWNDIPFEEIEHEGSSRDNEVVLKIA